MQFQHIPLGLISPNPENPRKTFEEIGLEELAASIREKGVLQPILVRPLGDEQFQIICGERRFRASTLAGLAEIPATIREMTDEEALEAMLMENFQRQDVHPIEEALGFAALRRINQMTPSQIAAKVGKSHQYVTNRLKLASLIPELHEPFYNGRFDMATALAIAVLSDELQREWFEEQDADEENWSESAYRIGNMTPELNSAGFDLTQDNLVPFVGACIGCQFNTASSSLFPEEVEKPRCLNRLCFDRKKSAGILQVIERAKEQGLPIVLDYHMRMNLSNYKEVDQALTGATVYTYHEITEIDAPVLENYLDDLGEGWDPEFYDGTEEEWNKETSEQKAEYERALAEYNEEIQGPSVKAGIKLMNGFEHCSVHFTIDAETGGQSYSPQKVKVSEIADKVKSGEASDEERTSAILQLQEQMRTAEEVKVEGVYIAARSLFKDVEVEEDCVMNPVFFEDAELSDAEMSAAVFVMLQKIGGRESARFACAFFGITEDDEQFIDSWYVGVVHAFVIKRLAKGNGVSLTAYDKFARAWTRFFTFRDMPFNAGMRNVNTGYGPRLFIDVAKYHFEEQMEEVEAKQEQAYDKKRKNIEAKINIIKDGI